MMSWVKKRDVRFIKCPHTPSHMVMEGEGMPRRRSNRVTGWGGVLVLVLALSYNVKISRDDNFSKKVLNFFQDDSPPNYTLSRRTQQLLVFLSVPWCSQQLLFELNIIYPLLISFFYCWGWVNEVIFCEEKKKQEKKASTQESTELLKLMTEPTRESLLPSKSLLTQRLSPVSLSKWTIFITKNNTMMLDCSGISAEGLMCLLKFFEILGWWPTFTYALSGHFPSVSMYLVVCLHQKATSPSFS